jgi:hypothetical protein
MSAVQAVLGAAESVLVLGTCGAVAVRALRRDREAARRYGKSHGLHWRRTRRRVPGRPRDGFPLTGEEEGTLTVIERGLKTVPLAPG